MVFNSKTKVMDCILQRVGLHKIIRKLINKKRLFKQGDYSFKQPFFKAQNTKIYAF